MRRELVILAGIALEVAIPENRAELEAGWKLMPPDAVGMLFEIKPHAPFYPLWVPVKIEGDNPLDVLWILEGEVESLVTLQSGCVQGYGDSVMEVPAGFCKEREIKVGARLIVGGHVGLGC